MHYSYLICIWRYLNEIPWAQNLLVLGSDIGSFVRIIKILNNRILTMVHCLTCKVPIQQMKETCHFCQKAYMQRYYPQLLYPNPKILNVPLDGQVLVPIFWGRYICMEKKAHHHHLLCKGCR